MNACRRHATGRCLVGLQPPVRRVEAEELVMAEICLDLQQPTESSRLGGFQDLSDRGLETTLVTHAQHKPRLAAKRNGGFGAGSGQIERLFAEYMLACGDDA